MKKFTKLLGIVLIIALVMSMGISAAFASDPPAVDPEPETPAASTETVTIKVAQDSTYAGTEGEAGRTFKWYKVFSATYGSDFTASNASGYGEGGVPNFTAGGTTGISYIASAAVAAKLAAEGNLWFDTTAIAGSTDVNVKWKSTVTPSAENVQAAAQWLYDNQVWDGSGDLAWTVADKAWEATVTKGYYLIVSDTGANLVAATTDVDINEKNSYPPLDKTQADEDDAEQNDTVRNVAVGDELTYNVTVTVPATVKVGDTIEVWDKASAGLTFKDGSLTVTPTGAATAATAGEGYAWRQTITITEDNIATLKGAKVVFEFIMTVNEDAVIDTGKTNESGLKYGHDGDYKYESIPDHVEYKTYFAGIHKIDGTTKEDLEGVKFTLKEAGVEFPVKLVTDAENGNYYIYDASGSSEVVTDAEGMIRIRGLDADKTYTLTEKETLEGYNMLTEDVTLSLHDDTFTTTTTTEGGESTTTTTNSYNGATDDSWGEVKNNKGTVLPSTGGIGTTIFYVVGSILVVAAGVLLVTKKRMSREG